jgi:hypothetical protein
MASFLRCLAVFAVVAAASELQESNALAEVAELLDAANVLDLKANGTSLHQSAFLLQDSHESQQGPIMEWIQSWFSDESNNLNASAQFVDTAGHVKEEDAVGSSVKGHVVAVPLQSQLLQESPGFRAPRNSSTTGFVDQKIDVHHNESGQDSSGAVVEVKLESQLWQRKSSAKSRDDEQAAFLAPRGAVEHDVSETPSLINEFALDVLKHCTTCMWLSIGLLVGCCCFSGAAHSTAGQLLGGFFNCILPLGVIIYVCHMTSLFSDFWHSKPICNWCMAICIWSFIQIAFGLCFLGLSVLGIGATTIMRAEKMEEEKQLK